MRRMFVLSLSRWTQTRREARWQCRRCSRSDFRRREQQMLWSTSRIFRRANFFQRGPTGAVSRKPLRNILISLSVKPISLAKQMSRTR